MSSGIFYTNFQQTDQRCINEKTYHDFHFKNDCISSVSTELSPMILRFFGFKAILQKRSVRLLFCIVNSTWGDPGCYKKFGWQIAV